ncbi:MAG: hypothetical protein L0216_19240 [Planctomycetales bacterium]|nr:hypothetical protein [Planctomycetales bacterium]
MVPPTATATEQEIQGFLAAERARLLKEEGVEEERVHHFHKPVERPFTAADRPKTTILFGGLTLRHERLCKAAMEGLGYRIEIVQTPDVKSFQLGKEFGNNGQCNPTYFTVGNLVKHLQGLRTKGMPLAEILDQYVFLTAGACGPCRFGMYEAEYRLALRNSGFDGFRVILFQQKGGLSQSDVEAGLAMNMDFFLGILNAMNMGDLLNEVGYQIRPYEVNPGETDRVLSEVTARLESRLREKPRPTLPAWVERRLPRGGRKALEYVVKFVDQLASDYYTEPLGEARDRLARIPVDYARVRPIVKITGEFWAQTTEGDGNFRMFRFLEGEGAQVLVEPIATWINYMLWQAQQGARDRKGIEGGQAPPPWWRLDRWARIERKFLSKLAKIRLAEALFKREYGRFCEALGGTAHTLTDQYELQRLGHPYYNSKAQGGEGHLEVAKNIYYSNKDLAHMVLSLKPFGCMPSTQSDGAQSAVVSTYKDMIYLPIETSGEGEVNAHSRVQMALGEARSKARAEFQGVLERTGLTVEAVRDYVSKHPDLHLDRALLHLPEVPGIVGTGARFVRHVAELMGRI